jgi:hypothetical protein
MSIKQLYGYFFYILYRMWLRIDKGFGATGPFPTKMKALICMFGVEVWLVFAVALYCGYFFNIHPHIAFFSFIGLAPFIVLLIMKWFIFEKADRWKNYVNEFDSWPPKRNRVGTWIVILLILFIILNFIYSLYLNPPPGGLKW